MAKVNSSSKVLALVFCGAVLFSSCSLLQKKAPEAKPIAKVFDSYLYSSDLQSIIPKGRSKADSLSIILKYIDQWVNEQILLHQAKNNLSEKQMDINKQIDDYKNALIIYEYEKELVRQKLDTVVNDDEIQ